MLEISVNNKVENFDYDDFRRQLFTHYEKAGASLVPRPAGLGKVAHKDLFQLEAGISHVFKVERRPEKADIMRLSFRINSEHMDELSSDPDATKQLIENYCVSPFRSVYAKVYRSNSHS